MYNEMRGVMVNYSIRNMVIVFLAALLLLGISGCTVKNEQFSPVNPAAVGGSGAANSLDPQEANADRDSSPDKAAPDSQATSAGEDANGAQSGAASSDGVDNAKQSQISSTGKGTVSLLISRNYGRQNLIRKHISLEPGWTILDVLNTTAQVTTKWDGSFVDSINGMQSNSGGLTGKNHDWFYFINGICADVGAPEYILRAGEKVWWDYHAWGNTGLTNPAVIGCYPEPFVHGYRGKSGPTTVMSSAANSSLAQAVQQALQAQGAASVQCSALNNELLQNRPGPIIVVGTWDELKQLPWLDGFNKSFRKNGTSVHFKDDGVELLDGRGKVIQNSGPGTGIIAASAAGLGNYKVLWLLAGTDQNGLQNAVNTMVHHPQQLNGLYHAAVISGQVIRLPLE